MALPITAWPPDVAPDATAIVGSVLMLWLADKLFGGAVEHLGGRIVDALMARIGGRDKYNPLEVAWREAEAAARLHGCLIAPRLGPLPTNGSYQLEYDLHGAAGSPCRHHRLIIRVSKVQLRDEHPPFYVEFR